MPSRLVSDHTQKSLRTPGPQPGYQQQQAGNTASPGLQPRAGESQSQAGRRTREAVRATVERNGGKPADLG